MCALSGEKMTISDSELHPEDALVNDQAERSPTWQAVSLFSNCGVGDFGYRRAGFRFKIMADLESRRLEVARVNHPEAHPIPGDLRREWHEVIRSYREKVGDEPPALIAACPPCQGLSSAFGDRGNGNDPDTSDERNLLVVVIAEVAQQLQPRFIVVENIPQFLTRKVRHPETQEAVSAAKLLVSTLEPDYAVFPILTNLAHYGVPQNRNRTFLTFVKRDLELLRELVDRKLAPYPRPTHDPTEGGLEPITLRSALESFGLPSLDARTEDLATSDERDLHFVPVWDDRRYDMVAAIPINSGASAWDNKVCEEGHEAMEVGEDDALCPICESPLLRPVVQENGTYRLVKGFRSSSYRRMHPDRPAATITTASGHVGSAYTIHPYENRLFSPLECALLQTIPEKFSWGDALENWGHTNVRDMIGEAVPPAFTEMHGQILTMLLRGEIPTNLLSDENERAKRARKKLDLDALWETHRAELL
jgi:DNA (cytosine-5)-methyltransferase 1